MHIDHPPYNQPDSFLLGNYYNQDGHRIRYGYMPAENNEVARAVMMGGQTSYIEIFYESFRDLAKMGISTYYTERFGDGGSERQYPHDPEKPPTLPMAYHVNDLNFFVENIVPRNDEKPLIHLGHCIGGLIGLHYMQTNPTTFDFSVMTSPMFGSSWNAADTPEKERKLAAFQLNDKYICRYVGKAHDWSNDKLFEEAAKGYYSHDRVRGVLDAEWWSTREDLRLGGYTFGNGVANLKGLNAMADEGTLENILTPVTILSPTEDKINRPERHKEFASRLPNGQLIEIVGARHALWRETDEYRQTIFDAINANLKKLAL